MLAQHFVSSFDTWFLLHGRAFDLLLSILQLLIHIIRFSVNFYRRLIIQVLMERQSYLCLDIINKGLHYFLFALKTQNKSLKIIFESEWTILNNQYIHTI